MESNWNWESERPLNSSCIESRTNLRSSRASGIVEPFGNLEPVLENCDLTFSKRSSLVIILGDRSLILGIPLRPFYKLVMRVHSLVFLGDVMVNGAYCRTISAIRVM